MAKNEYKFMRPVRRNPINSENKYNFEEAKNPILSKFKNISERRLPGNFKSLFPESYVPSLLNEALFSCDLIPKKKEEQEDIEVKTTVVAKLLQIPISFLHLLKDLYDQEHLLSLRKVALVIERPQTLFGDATKKFMAFGEIIDYLNINDVKPILNRVTDSNNPSTYKTIENIPFSEEFYAGKKYLENTKPEGLSKLEDANILLNLIYTSVSKAINSKINKWIRIQANQKEYFEKKYKGKTYREILTEIFSTMILSELVPQLDDFHNTNAGFFARVLNNDIAFTMLDETKPPKEFQIKHYEHLIDLILHHAFPRLD